jgi:signal transduction histidine kinase
LPGAAGQELGGQLNLPALPLRGRLVETLARCREPIETSALAARLAAGPLAPEEQESLAAPVALWLPLHSAATLQGILALGPRRQGELFTARDRQLLMTLAYAAATTLHNVQLLAAVRAAHDELIGAHQQLSQAREQERRHVAAELHDGVLQQLLGLDYQLHRAQRLAGAAAPNGAGEPLHLLGAARQELAGAVRQLRASLGALHPADLDTVGLRAAVAEYIEQVTGALGPGAPAVTWDGGDVEPPLPALHQLCLYRCVQEGVRNALRHAQARHIGVRLHWEGGGALVEVVDDGQGFETPARLSQFARRQHFGLIGVEERVHALGGKFAIHSEPGGGAVLRVWIPAAGEPVVQNHGDGEDGRREIEGW